jgi:hypothetical protein
MTAVDVKKPVFKILLDHNTYVVEQKAMRLFREEGWYPIGGVGRRGNDWVQVMVRDGSPGE